jgi:hypothetical protein
MHFLPLQDIDELHLLLESLHKLISLLLKLPVVLHEPFHIAPLPLILTLLGDSGFPQLQFHLF